MGDEIYSVDFYWHEKGRKEKVEEEGTDRTEKSMCSKDKDLLSLYWTRTIL